MNSPINQDLKAIDPPLWTLALVGFDPASLRFFETVIDLGAGIEFGRWRLVESVEQARVVFVDVDTDWGRATFTRLQREGVRSRSEIVLCSHAPVEDYDSERWLPLPLSYPRVVALLRELDASLAARGTGEADTLDAIRNALLAWLDEPSPAEGYGAAAAPDGAASAGIESAAVCAAEVLSAAVDPSPCVWIDDQPCHGRDPDATASDSVDDLADTLVWTSEFPFGLSFEVHNDPLPLLGGEAFEHIEIRAEREARAESDYESDGGTTGDTVILLTPALEARGRSAAGKSDATSHRGRSQRTAREPTVAEAEIQSPEPQPVLLWEPAVDATGDANRGPAPALESAAEGLVPAMAALATVEWGQKTNWVGEVFDPATRFLGLVEAIIAQSRAVVVTHEHFPPIEIYPGRDAFFFPHELDAWVAMYREPADRFALHALADNAADDAGRLQQTKALWRLLFAAALYGSEGRWLKGVDATARMRLVSLPNLLAVPYAHDFSRIVNVMLERPATAREIAETSGVSIATVTDFCNACFEVAMLELVPASTSTAAKGEAVHVMHEFDSTTALHRIRRRLGADRASPRRKGLLRRLLGALRGDAQQPD